MLSERESIAIAEVAVYLPFIVVAIYVCARHGFVRQLGWIYLVIFCGLRIAAGVMGILYAKHPTSRTDATWSAILGSIGLSPLLLAGLGLIERCNKFLQGKSTIMLILRLSHIPIILGLILAIVGGNKLSDNPNDTSDIKEGEKFEKAGGIVFLIGYVILFGATVVTGLEWRNLPWGEKRVLGAVVAALPLLAVRLLYSLISDFADNNTFNILYGNATVQLCMAIVEEMIVTVFYLIAGVTAPSWKSLQGGPDQMAMQQKPGQFQQQV